MSFAKSAKATPASLGALAAALVAQLRESYRSDTMRSMKIAISLPDPIFEAAEHLAEELRIPRSQLYAEALANYLNTHGGAAITAKLNEVHGSIAVPVEPALAKAQLRILDREAW
jgi:predicted transcriptional regulator